MDKYQNRHQNLETTSLKEFSTCYQVTKGQIKRLQKPLILQIKPHRTPNGPREQQEDYFKQQLLLYKPFRDPEALKTHSTWKQSYESSEHNVWQLNTSDEVDDDECDEFTPCEVEQHEWIANAEAFPNETPSDTEIGYREIDRNHHWYEAFFEYEEIEKNMNLIPNAKKTFEIPTLRSYENIPFNEGQRSILDHLDKQLNGERVSKRCIVQGPAGTGKSCVIREMIRKVEDRYGDKSVLLLAPTGIAANNISGTIADNTYCAENTSKKE